MPFPITSDFSTLRWAQFPILRLVRVLALLLVVPLVAAESQSGVVTGRVSDAVTEEALSGATVRVIGQTASAITDPEGRFTLRGVDPGIVRLEVRRIGYAPVIRTDVAVSAGKPVVVAVALNRLQVQLAQVDVRPAAFPGQQSPTTPVSSTNLTSEELRRTPGALEDVVAALSVTPGIAPTGGGRNDLFVRGGASYENLFVVDNVEVPNINHFGTQGATGGPLSLMNVRFIDNAAISAGGFGVRYGDRVASVTNLTLREGNRERMSGEVNIAASQYGFIVEGPLGGEASYLFNARRSYLDLLFKALGVAFVPTYTDATLKVVWRPNAHNAFSFLTVGAVDEVNFNNETADNRVTNSQVVGTSQDQYFSGLTWKRLFRSGVTTTTLGRTWSRYETAQYDSLQPPNPIFRASTEEGEMSLRSDLTWQATNALEVDAGTITKLGSRLRYNVLIPGFLRLDQNGAPQPLSVDTSFTALRNSTYAQVAVQATPVLRLTAGLRGDWYEFLNSTLAVAPRVSATLAIDPATSATLSLGRYHQAPQYIWLVGDPGNAARLAPLRADQVVLGLQRLVGDEWRWQVEAYAKRYSRYPGRLFRPNAVLQPSGFDDATQDIPFGLEPLDANASGTVWGAEAIAQKKLGALPFYGLVAVSYNRTSFKTPAGTATRGAFDTPLIANVVGGWRPNAKWELSGRMRTASGLPYTPVAELGAAAGSLDFARYNAERLPVFFSVDGRADRRWVVGRTQLVTFIDVTNLNGKGRVTGYRWNPRTRVVEQQTSIAILPTIGINWEF